MVFTLFFLILNIFFHLSDVKDGDEELYESIYEVIQPLHHRDHNQNSSNNCSFESESDFDEIYADPSVISGSGADEDQLKDLNLYSNTAKLTKLAEAANKKMKKLRRNWSLKKSDISKSWSRIRKYSSPGSMIGSNPAIHRPAFPISISHSNTLKRKPSRRSCANNNNNTNVASAAVDICWTLSSRWPTS